MHYLNKISSLIVLFFLSMGASVACEQYTNLTIDEIKEFRGMLGKTDADPLDRLFAFEQMVCSDRPNIRSYAVKQGLDTIQDPLVRNEVMFKALMQKTRIDIELAAGRDQTDYDKQFVTTHGGLYSKLIQFRSEKAGCISLFKKNNCESETSVFIIGDKVELNFSKVTGTFRLSGSGELVGTLRAENSDRYTNIPAVIKLF